MEYTEAVNINPHNIQEELERQPSLYMEYAELHADAVFEREKLKQKLDLLYIELDIQTRNDKELFWGNKKPTEKEIEGKVLTDPRYIKAQRALSQSSHNVNVLAAAKEAISQKKAILGNIVSMIIAGLYSTPKPKGDNERALVLQKTTKTFKVRRA